MIAQKCHVCGRDLPGDWPAVRLKWWGMFRTPARGLVIEPTGAVSGFCRHCRVLTIFVCVEEARQEARQEIRFKRGA